MPFPAGGITDIIGRIIAEGMRQHLGQPVIVENAPGAGGTIGLTKIARATPDGYTFGIGQWTSQVGGSAMYNLTFDVHKDIQPIALVSVGPLWIVGRKDLPANNLTGAGRLAQEQSEGDRRDHRGRQRRASVPA